MVERWWQISYGPCYPRTTWQLSLPVFFFASYIPDLGKSETPAPLMGVGKKAPLKLCSFSSNDHVKGSLAGQRSFQRKTALLQINITKDYESNPTHIHKD